MTSPEDPWRVSDKNFPTGGSLEDQIRFLIGYATLAPSGHNTQPWLFGTGPDWVDVIADRRRALPVVDPHDRELTISCGAAIGFLEVAARRFSLHVSIANLPDPDTPDHLARLTVAKGAPASDAELALFNAMKHRRTDRSAYFMEDLPTDLMPACQDIAKVSGVGFQGLEEDEVLETVAGLVAEGDRLQFDDISFRRELASWVHSSRFGSRDGMSGAAFGMPDILAPAARLVIRTFDLGDNVAAADEKKILAGSPALGLLSSTSDSPEDWLNTGRALAKVLLFLTSQGHTASYLNQPIEVDTLRSKLQQACGLSAFPQILLRIGRSETELAPAVRRDLSEVMLTT